MAVLVSAHQISKTFGAHPLFSKISFSVDEGQRVALIGPNGAGKSTLLKILAQQAGPDEGKVTFAQGLRIGYLEQSPRFEKNEGLIDTLLGATMDPEDPENIGWVWELYSKFGFEEGGYTFDQGAGELSGGWQKKLALAREMAKRPNLLLLDEPTNHLDIESILWLEDWVARQNELACLIITHDRLFLQNTCDRIFDLDRKNPEGIIKFEGDYAEFLEVKDSLLSAQARLEDSRRNVLRRETAWLRRGAKARQTKQKSRIERAKDLAEEVASLEDQRRERIARFQFGGGGRSPKKLIEAQNITKKFGEKTLFKNFDFILPARARVGLIGANGAGKSTFIKALLGQVPLDQGTIKITEGVKYSYFEQKKESLDPQQTVLRNICPEGDYVHLQGQPVFARSYLSRFHFRPEQMDMPADRLSGGEQSRLLLARMMLQSEQVLVLDEPTNDLDVNTLDTLQEALEAFPGAIILVTHDRYFMDQVATEIYAFDGRGGVERFADYFQWEEWIKTKKGSDGGAPKHSANSIPVSRETQIQNSPKKRKLSYKEQFELDSMEERILKEEGELEALQKELSSPALAADHEKLTQLTQQVGEKQLKIEALYQRWSELSSK